MHPLHVALALAAATAISAVAAALGWLWRRRRGSGDAACFVGLAIAAATTILFVQQQGWPTPNPARGFLALNPLWAAYLLVAGVLGVLTTAVGLTNWFGRGQILTALEKRWLAAVFVGAALLALLRFPDSGGRQSAHIAALCAPPLVLLLSRVLERDRGIATSASMALAMAGAAFLTLESGFAKGGLVIGAGGAALGAISLVSLWRPIGLGLPAGSMAVGLLVAGMALGRAYESETSPAFPGWIWLLPGLIPLAAFVGCLPAVHDRPARRAIAIIGTALAALLITVGLALLLNPASAAGGEDDLSNLYG